MYVAKRPLLISFKLKDKTNQQSQIDLELWLNRGLLNKKVLDWAVF